jgi:hypothetical protein
MEVSFKEHCITLRKEGRSLIEIMHITGRAKASIHFHIQNLPLSAERWEQIRKKSGEHIRKFAIARKGKSIREFKTFDRWTPNKVLLIAHLIFDGEILKKKCAYNNRSESLISRFETLTKELYSYQAKRHVNALTGVIRIAHYNVELSAYLHKRAKELLKVIGSMSPSHKREFVRAFFDDEGCITFSASKKRQVRGYQKDNTILFLIQKLLRDFRIESRIQIPNEVVISGKENLRKFQKEINFSEGVRINGDRSNSIWKESFEKRDLLDRAIKSFKN